MQTRLSTIAAGLTCATVVFTATGCGGVDADAAESTTTTSAAVTTAGATDGAMATSAAASESAPARVSTESTSEGVGEQGSDSNSTLPTGTGPQSSPASTSADLTLTDIRVGKHPGFDRVVYEFTGPGTPGWRARYVDSAVQDNSLEPISVAGEGIIQIYINQITFPSDDSGVRSFPPVSGAGGVVTEVKEGASWSEGDMQSFIGTTRSQRPFTVFTLSGPTRVVVDIAN